MSVEDVDVVVELLLDRGPVFEGLGDRVLFIDKVDRDGLLGTVGIRLQAEVFEPLLGPVAEAVHRTVEVDRGHGLVNIEDALHHGQVLVACCAFIVDDEVVAFGPVVLSVDRQGRFDRPVIRPPDVDADIGTLGDAFGQHLLLAGVVVTATSRDEEDPERLGRVLGAAGEDRDASDERRKGEGGEEGEFHGNRRLETKSQKGDLSCRLGGRSTRKRVRPSGLSGNREGANRSYSRRGRLCILATS